MTRYAEGTTVSPERSQAEISVACFFCGAPVGQPCRRPTGAHPSRRQRARKAGAYAVPDLCCCRNHMGTPKVQHKSRSNAVAWMINQAHHGMRYEPYPCPTKPGTWHVRTARDPRPEVIR